MDLEKLETVSVNRVAEELKEKLREQEERNIKDLHNYDVSSCLLYTSPSPRDATLSRMPSSA